MSFGTKTVLSVLALSAACIVAALVLAVPTLRPEMPILAALALLYVGVGLALGLPRKGPGVHVLWPVLGAVILLPFAVVARGFGRVDMMAFFFHAQLGIDFGSVLTLKDEIIASAVSVIIFLAGTWYLLSVIRPHGRVALVVLPAAVVLLVGINPLSAHVLRTVLFQPPDLQLGQKMVTPVPAARPQPLPDLVHVYLEGLDRRFSDPTLGGDSYEPLQALAAQGLSLTNIGQITGTGWSLGGMVASQCGVPVLPRGLLDLKNLEAVTDFMPGLICLGDILDGHGYRVEFIVGGDEAFAGISAFYATHGADEIWGMLRQARLHPRDDVLAADLGWILDDQLVYDTARQRFELLAAAEEPFAIVVETSGPHGKTGSLSRSCTPDGRAVASSAHAPTARCLAGLTQRFIEDIRTAHLASGRPNPLRIVVQSDHLYHDRHDIPAREELERNTVILLGGAEVGQVIGNPGSMIDVYPTLLVWLGFDAPMAGLGRSLLGEAAEMTLVGQYGLDGLSAGLLNATDLVDFLWSGGG